jgi:hypothetical protein
MGKTSEAKDVAAEAAERTINGRVVVRLHSRKRCDADVVSERGRVRAPAWIRAVRSRD